MTENLENEAQASSSDSMSDDSNFRPTRNIFVGEEGSQPESQGETQTSESENSKNSESETLDLDKQDNAESKADVSIQTGAQQQASDNSEKKKDDKIVMTKAEMDAEAKKIREIEHRKAKREIERELAAKYNEQMRQSQNTQQQTYGVPPQPTPNHIWVADLGQWIDPNMSVADFINSQQQVGNQAGMQTQQPANSAQFQQQIPQNQEAAQHQFAESVWRQRDECDVKMPDFKDTMLKAPLTENMVEAACVDPSGMTNLYQMAKDAPHELYAISKLPVHEQQHRMWLMNEKFKKQKAEKLKTKATEQAAPLTNTGEVSKPENGLSLEELKRKRHNQYWDAGG